MKFSERHPFILDMDGVVVNTEEKRAVVLQSLLEQRKIQLDASFAATTYGRTAKTIFHQDFGHILSPGQIEEILSEYKALHKQYPGEYALPIESTLAFIRGNHQARPLALASMSSRTSVDAIVKKFSLEDKFLFTLARDDVVSHKPDPEIYLQAAHKLAASPRECVAFEDTVTGATAALAAGMICYGFLNGHNSEKDFAGLAVAGYIKTLADYNQLVS